MPRGIHPNSLANLQPWSSTFHPSGLGVRARRLKAASRFKTQSETLIQPDSTPSQDTSELVLVRERIKKAESMFDKERIPMRLEQLAGTIARLRQVERRLTGEKVDRPAARAERKPVAPLPKPVKPDAP